MPVTSFRRFFIVASLLTSFAAPGFAQETATTTPETAAQNQDAQQGENQQDPERPNILIIWGDDIGMWNISAYHRGMMGGETPNIDQIADEGMIFMDHYGHASCTAGRASFILGQYPMRTGLSTVGLPGAEQGIQADDPTIAELLKPLGYATGQFGKNHLGDRDEHLPTKHGFDEFFGILYHLNAGEYPEQYDFPSEEVQEEMGLQQRGVIQARALDDGDQEVQDLGPFGTERQRVLDDEVMVQSVDFIRRAVEAGDPFFVWHNFSRMHYRTNLKPESDGVTGYGLYADGMREVDNYVGQLLDLLDELGVADNTIVMFSTDNGAASNSWPDGGNQPFHGEKGVGGYEGGFRVPMMVKWDGRIPAGVSTGEFMTMEDWMPTLLSFLGDKTLKEDLLEGKQVGDTTYRVHLDGYDQSDILLNNGETKRKEFFYFTETTFQALRYGDYKLQFRDQDAWFRSPQPELSTPIITNLKLDPFERFHESRGYDEWAENRSWLMGPAGKIVADYVATFEEFPPRQRSMSVQMSDVAEMLYNAGGQ
ncbi:arylsulfatase [Paracoccus aerodenitrificans]|uniref:arylsulfatase n=1 Tax=Paracoccus aerodenitrificans TaxID=3017781 RepID=UPI0022F07838|nr:arylsulfatase [Paracoccus aerodenitrificans]